YANTILSKNYHIRYLLVLNSNCYTSYYMFENLAYRPIGFVVMLFGLEAAWHFTACTLPDNTIKPCVYKQVNLAW
ncbi:MAG: hypothetical protein WA667_28465, partial [Candidatus Nitrosopolaris sp.]